MPPRIGTSDLTILIVSGLTMAALTIVSFLIAPVDSTPQEPGSSYSAEPDGVRAAYLVLQELGHDVARSVEPIAALDADPATTTLVLANPAEPPSKGDQQALARFVQEGGVVIAFGRSSEAFLPGVTAKRERGQRGQAVEGFPAALPGALTRGARELSAYRTPPPPLDPAYVPVYGSLDNPAVVTATFGEGRIIWCLDSTVVQNDGIARSGSVTLIANAAGVPRTRTIAWDEYYHGQRRSFWSYVAGTPLFWGVLQLGLAAVALLAGVSRRRGPLRPRVAEPRTSPLEFIDTMASLYERAGDATSAVRAARDRLRRRLAVVAGLPAASPDDRIVAIAAPRVGLDAERTREALARAEALVRQGAAPEAEAVRIVAELQDALVIARG